MTSNFRVLLSGICLLLSVGVSPAHAQYCSDPNDRTKCDDYVEPAPTQNQVQQVQQATAKGDPAKMVSQCEDDTQEALKFCKDPIAGLSDGMLGGGAEVGALGANLMGVAMMFAGAGDNDSNKKICQLMKTGGMSMTGVNGGFASGCLKFISSCEETCTVTKANKGTLTATQQNEMAADLRSCSSMRRRANEMTSAAAQAANSAMMGKLCGDAVKTNESYLNAASMAEMPAVGTDCALNPTDPLCAGSGTVVGTLSTIGSGSSESGTKGPNDFNIGDTSNDPTQSGVTGGGALDGAKNGGVANGGGSMLGSGGGAGGGGGDEKGGRGAGGGYKTDILQGERAGGGYNVSAGAVGSGGGGWSGYGASEEKKDKGFDLRKYLPGQANTAARGPAGLNRASAGLGAMHEDIFKKISDRVVTVCRTNRLRDCR